MLHEKKRAADIGSKEIVKVLQRVVFNCCGLGDSGIGHEYIQSISDDRADVPCQQSCSIWGSQVCADGICESAFGADARNEGLRVLCRSAIVDQDSRAGLGKRGRYRASNSA